MWNCIPALTTLPWHGKPPNTPIGPVSWEIGTEYYPLIADNLNFGIRANLYDNKHLYLESWDYTNIRVETLINWRVASFVDQSFL